MSARSPTCRLARTAIHQVGLRAGCTLLCIYLFIIWTLYNCTVLPCAYDKDVIFVANYVYCRVQNRLHCTVPRLVPQSLFHLVGGRNRMVVDRVERDPSEYCINQVYTKIQL